MHELSWQLAGIENVACLDYGVQSLKLSLTTDRKELVATSYNRIGLAYDYSGDFEKALENYQACLRIREDIGDLEGKSASYNNIGGVYYYMGDYDQALDYYLQSLEIRYDLQKKGVEKADLLIGQSHNNMAMVFKAMGDYEKAIVKYKESLKIKLRIKDQLGICTSTSNIGALYLALNQLDSARASLDEALLLAEKLDNNFNIIMIQNNLGLLDIKQGNYAEAIVRYEDIIKIEVGNTNNIGEGTARINLSSALMESGNYQDAAHQAKLANELGMASGSLILQQNALALLNEIYKGDGKPKLALEYFEKYAIIKDSIFNLENNSRYNDLLISYETAKKEDSIKELNYENELLAKDSDLKEQEIETKTWIGYLLGAAALFLLLALILFVRNAGIRKKALIRENELRLQNVAKEMDGLRARLEGELDDKPKSNLAIDQTLLNEYLMNELSERELEVLKEVAEGKTNKEIAEILFVSVNTIKTHILNIYDKLDVQNRTQAAVKAGSLQILKESEEIPS